MYACACDFWQFCWCGNLSPYIVALSGEFTFLKIPGIVEEERMFTFRPLSCSLDPGLGGIDPRPPYVKHLFHMHYVYAL